MSETPKSFDRRVREGFFKRYTQNLGIDIGCGDCPVTNEVEKWDSKFGHGDATFMGGVPDNHFDYVHSFHCLEHLDDPINALRNWLRICKPYGWLIVGVPHRDLYEKTLLLPSRWNGAHKTFWLPHYGEPPHTLGLLEVAHKAFGVSVELQSLRVLDDNIIHHNDPLIHSDGEYSIEGIWRKKQCQGARPEPVL
jgi:SAM-dependent methyltransferase